jgi:CheY-like chemotaxis protein
LIATSFHARRNQTSKRIFIVDDEIDVAQLLRGLLEDCGYVVETAKDGISTQRDEGT